MKTFVKILTCIHTQTPKGFNQMHKLFPEKASLEQAV
jgi:hypothetical protein